MSLFNPLLLANHAVTAETVAIVARVVIAGQAAETVAQAVADSVVDVLATEASKL